MLERDLTRAVWAKTISAMDHSDCEPQLPRRVKAPFRNHSDSVRAVTPAIERALGNTMWGLGDKFLETLWHLLAFGRQGIEKEVEFAPAYEANVADFHRLTRLLRTWVP